MFALSFCPHRARNIRILRYGSHRQFGPHSHVAIRTLISSRHARSRKVFECADQSQTLSRVQRYGTSRATKEIAETSAVVIGAGPGGLAAVSSLLDANITSVLWVDRTFQGGRLNENYREISSNTEVGRYIDAIRSSPTCLRIIDSAPTPNAVTRLEEIDRKQTFQLSLAGDIHELVIEGMLNRKEVEQVMGEVTEARFDPEAEKWIVQLSDGRTVPTGRIILATGSHPAPEDFHQRFNPSLRVLDLDRCMLKSTLPELFMKTTGKSVVAVVGNSHSGILVCRNLYELKDEGKVDLKIINFQRQPIKYAIFRDDGIVNDNTGLKGATADWARDVMEANADASIIQQVQLNHLEDEDRVYAEWLPQCTHIVYAIGYKPNPIPRLYVGDRRIDEELEFDMTTSGFRLKDANKSEQDQSPVRGLFGCGIAFPERLADPEGNIEAAVGVGKFFRFAKRVRSDWVRAH